MKKMSNKDNTELTIRFFELTKTLRDIEKLIEKYKDSDLHDGLSRMYKGMEIFSAKMIVLTLEASDGNN